MNKVRGAALFIAIMIIALALSPWLVWNFIRYVRDGIAAAR